MVTLLKKVFYWLKILFFYITTFIVGLFVLKRKDLVVITASKGKYYNGNAKALFEYIQTRDDLEAYYFISKKSLFDTLSKERNNIVYHYSLKGLRLFVRARTVCITHGYADFLGYFPSIWQNWIYLGHGIGTKALGYLKNKLSLLEKLQIYFNKFYFYIITSDFDRYMFSAMNHKKPSKIIITGYPRTDELYREAELKKKKNSSNILYAPTYREDGITEVFHLEGFSLSKLTSFLEEKNIFLNIRFHPNNYLQSREAIGGIINSSDNIIDKSPDVIGDPQDLLIDSDILITDYSSISRDYLFLDRPMIFTMNDIGQENKLSLPPIRKEFAFPGYKIMSYLELENALSEIIEGKDRFSESRQFVRDLSYNYIDGNSSRRVTNLIKDLANVKND